MFSYQKIYFSDLKVTRTGEQSGRRYFTGKFTAYDLSLFHNQHILNLYIVTLVIESIILQRHMNYTRIYSDSEGESHFEIVEVPLKENSNIGYLSDGFAVRSLQFRENKADYSWDFHHAPERQFIILLDGEIEITTSLGETRRFSTGDILLTEDTFGKGHKTRNIKKQIRKSIFVKI
jgi:hypothetical protein